MSNNTFDIRELLCSEHENVNYYKTNDTNRLINYLHVTDKRTLVLYDSPEVLLENLHSGHLFKDIQSLSKDDNYQDIDGILYVLTWSSLNSEVIDMLLELKIPITVVLTHSNLDFGYDLRCQHEIKPNIVNRVKFNNNQISITTDNELSVVIDDIITTDYSDYAINIVHVDSVDNVIHAKNKIDYAIAGKLHLTKFRMLFFNFQRDDFEKYSNIIQHERNVEYVNIETSDYKDVLDCYCEHLICVVEGIEYPQTLIDLLIERKKNCTVITNFNGNIPETDNVHYVDL